MSEKNSNGEKPDRVLRKCLRGAFIPFNFSSIGVYI